jgi:CheY-like chemotaxis protein
MGEIKRILLAEDNANDVELILAALTEDDLAGAVDVVRDGNEALDYLYRRGDHITRQAENPALVVLDIKMPKMGGLDVLGIIKKEASLKLIPVVMLTSSREEGDLLKSYQLGVNAYVVKPLDFSRFSAAVKQVGVFWAVINEAPPGSTRHI